MREKSVSVALRFPILLEMEAYIKAVDMSCYEVFRSQVILYCKLMAKERKLAIADYNASELPS